MANTTKTQTTKTPAPAPTPKDVATTILRDPQGLATGVTYTFGNGKSFTLMASELSDEMRAEALAHGLKQKVGDAAAIPRDTKTGRSATVDEKYAAAWEVYDRVKSGAWNAEREGGGGNQTLYKAVCRVYSKKSPEALKKWLDAKSDAERAALKKNPDIAKAILAIQAESAKASGVDDKALLAELDNIK